MDASVMPMVLPPNWVSATQFMGNVVPRRRHPPPSSMHTNFPGATTSSVYDALELFDIDPDLSPEMQLVKALHPTTARLILQYTIELLERDSGSDERCLNLIPKVVKFDATYAHILANRLYKIYRTTTNTVGQSLWLCLQEYYSEMCTRLEVLKQKELRIRQFDVNENRRHNVLAWPDAESKIVKTSVELRPKVRFIGRI